MKGLHVLFIVCLALVWSVLCSGQEVVGLWAEGAPSSRVAEGYAEVTVFKNDDPSQPRIRKVTDPTLTLYRPEGEGNGVGIVICPGGGYYHLSINDEGHKIAKAFASRGYTCGVLKYRLPSEEIMDDKSVGPLQDAQRAIRLMRGMGLSTVGIMGFSAGGHLAASASTLYHLETYKDDSGMSARPDFTVLGYPVISMRGELTHGTTRRQLIGSLRNEGELVHRFSTDENVDSKTPPAFLFHSADDAGVSCVNSLRYAEALRGAGVRMELHIFSEGGHGVGLATELRSKEWVELADTWIMTNKQ